jgi:hypothetical protein
MQVTEVLFKGESEHCVIPREELAKRLERDEVEGVFKFGLFNRDEPSGVVKAVHDLVKGGKYKGYVEGRPTASSTITSSQVDRDGDIVATKGMVLTDSYWANPVVLPMHTHDFPVGMTRRIKQYANSAWAEWEWLIDQDYTRANVFQRAWDAYVLNSTSVGFLPIEWNGDDDKAPGWVFAKWELMEHSPVVIPSNREALRTDGVRDVVEAFGEYIEAGPSPLVKGFWKMGLETMARPKQVAVEMKDELPMDPDLELAKESAEIEDEAFEGASAGLASVLDAYGWVDGGKVAKGVISYAAAHSGGTPKADPGREWDGPEEVRKADVDDLKVMCAWVDSEHADIKGGYKFAHHHQADKAVNKRACSAGIAVLNGGRGGTNIPDADRKGVYNHLAKHLRDDFDVPADEIPELKYFDIDEIRLAHAAGVIDTDEAYAEIEKLIKEIKTGAEAAQAEAEEWKTRCGVLSALVVAKRR